MGAAAGWTGRRYYNGNTSLPDERGHELGWGGMHMDGGGWSVSTAAEARCAS